MSRNLRLLLKNIKDAPVYLQVLIIFLQNYRSGI
jgi:hypothetical protein